MKVSIVIPVLNEERALPQLFAGLARLDPQPAQYVFVDGGSTDRTGELIRQAGFELHDSVRKGRGAQINQGVAAANGELVCVLHADSVLAPDAVHWIQQTLANQAIALAGFMPRLVGEGGTRWASTLHNIVKTWYAPLLFRPRAFFKGSRLLFGDHAMFFRRQQFLATGGCDERLAILEEADLCINLTRFGRVKLLRRWVQTSDRRIEKLGRWRANWIYLKVSVLWALGARERLGEHYPEIR